MATKVTESEALGQVTRPEKSAEVANTTHIAGSLGPGSAETDAERRARIRESLLSGDSLRTATRAGASQLAPVMIGPNQLDGPRIAAREAQYGNRQLEAEAVFGMDEAAFDRVRPVEQSMIARAEAFIDGVERTGSDTADPGVIESTESIVAQLNDLVSQLERGTPASQLAEQFKQLQNHALYTAVPKVLRALQAVEGSHLPNMEDPYGRVQNRIIAQMPISSFRPLRPRKR